MFRADITAAFRDFLILFQGDFRTFYIAINTVKFSRFNQHIAGVLFKQAVEHSQ